MKLFCASVLALTFATLTPSVEGAVLAYDGFAAGGTNPTSEQYNSGGAYPNQYLAFHDPSTLTGVTNGGQNPSNLGFKNAWSAPLTSTGQTSSSVGFRVMSTSLNYTDVQGFSMNTTPGSASYFRSSGNASEKTVSRAMDISAIPTNTTYISVLVNFTAGSSLEFDFQTLGGNAKPFFGFGVGADGLPYVQLSNSTNYLTSAQKIFASSALSANTTHLLVLKVEQNTSSPTQDTISLFVNPNLNQDLTNAVATYTGDFYVAGNTDYRWSTMGITGTVASGHSFTFDELRFTDTWIGAVPEPTQAALLMSAALGFCFRRKRTKSA